MGRYMYFNYLGMKSLEILQKMMSGRSADYECQVSGFQNWSGNLDPKTIQIRKCLQRSKSGKGLKDRDSEQNLR